MSSANKPRRTSTVPERLAKMQCLKTAMAHPPLINYGLHREMNSMEREHTSADSAMESADMADMLEVVRSIACASRSEASAPRSLSVGDSDAAALSVDMPGVVRTAGDDGACRQQCIQSHTTGRWMTPP